ncbi:pilus assembly protein [Aeromonas veronii]|uniref:pilus assembly protein n=1 Tax=Aeromonas veronii TaxID=654 RepID=UPI001F1C8B69|nr:PilC/PilY family type IV pilus protein [Aeromonas veronii]MCF5907525.1 pilus assembly protein [Aeromonas veronii]MCR3966223.1 PilC/PilY family type IV pilus protein [Aeromonas veronii]MCR3978699.1 PilC/PilY family type IV pilus protein [Aeromonas veronii]
MGKLGFGLSVMLCCASAQAALDIAQVPLYLGTRAEPNIMFTLDDSGSMHFEIMPESLIENDARYVYPRASQVYGSDDYDNYTITFASDNARNAYIRSSHNNKLYYNPQLTYRPWANADGSLMANAKVTCAPHNPFNTAAGCRDLTQTNRSSRAIYYTNFSPYYYNQDESFWPAVYFDYKGSGNVFNANSYNRVVINKAVATLYGYRPNRTDCKNAPVCSYDEEIQNFANWYTYYRSRILAARAGVGRAFASQGEGIRVGFATINAKDSVIRGVTTFTGTDRSAFFNELYGRDILAKGTPLRTGLKEVGKYFSRTDKDGPWAASAGNTLPHLTCRQSYNILMTDGYWNGDSPSVGDQDQDGINNTLADVAYKYWKTDLRSDLANKVPTSTADPANWQHLVNFTVGLGVNGSLNPANGIPSRWPNPYDSDEFKIDDLWHAAVNSKGSFFSAADPDTFAEALSSTLAQIAARNSSASSVTANATRLDSNTHIYQARYNSGDWSGQLVSIPLNSDGTLGEIAWDAATLIPEPSARNIFTRQDGVGIPFRWDTLNVTNRALFNVAGDNQGESRVAYLRGDRSGEQRNGGAFRNRSDLLGDIINSDPVYVGKRDYGYSSAAGLTQTEREGYQAFLSSTAITRRPPMLYVGANDGMLHGFRVSDGVERLGYLPASLLGDLPLLTKPNYSHRYYVDGTPKVGDAYLGTSWKTILLGSTGAGGKAVFAIDVTAPDNFTADKMLWEFTNSEMGVALAAPTLVRVKADNKWVALVANGYNSTSQTARLFVLDLATGAIIKVIDTQVGSASEPNGLSSPLPVDEDGDRVVDYVYAGDLQGNLWKFDLTDNNSAQWGSAFKSGNKPTPLFQACNGACSATTRQPITMRPLAIRHPKGGIMVLMGTGSYFSNDDKLLPTNPRLDAVYGIWDTGSEVSRSQLLQQSITHEFVANGTTIKFNVRVVSSRDVNYTSQKGWYLVLKSPGLSKGVGERAVSEMLYRHKRLIFNTLIPSADACDFGGRSWLMELDPISGARLTYSVFDVNGDGAVNDDDYVTIKDDAGNDIKVPVSGKQFDELTTTPSVVEDAEMERKYISGSSGNISVTLEEGAGDLGGRQSWLQLE